MTRKIRPIFTKYEACTQTNLASSAYDGQPGDPVELHHVVFPAVRKVGGRGKGKKAQSAHGASGYKRSAGYAEFQLPKSQKLKPSQVDGLLDRFGRFLEKKKKSVTEARKKIVPQEVAQAPGQKVGLVVDEKSLFVDVVEVVDVQPSTSEQSVSQPLNSGQVGFQSYVRRPGGFLPTTSGQWSVDSGQPSTSGSCGLQLDQSSACGPSGLQVDQFSTCGPGGFQVDQSSACGPGGFQVDQSSCGPGGVQVDQTSTCGFGGSQVDQFSTCGPVPAPVEAVSSVLGIDLTPLEATTVVTVGELAAALPFTKNPTLGASALPGSPEPVPNNWPSGQPDFRTLSDIDLLDPFLDWDLWSFERDIARLNAAHPWVLSGAADDVFVSDDQSKLPWEETDSEEEQGVGWGLHLGQEYWDIIPFLCDDGSR